MSTISSSRAAKAVIRRNTEEVQSCGNFEVFEEIFDDDFVDHTTQPNMTPDKAGVRKLYGYTREAFPDFRAEIHLATRRWRSGDDVQDLPPNTRRPFLGIAPTHRKIHLESVDVMHVRKGKITDHWGVENLFSPMRQLGALKP